MTYRILMDCDPGIDDACALSCALTDPEISLELITTVAGNVAVDKTTKNALRLVEFFSKDVPVAAGARKPLLKQLEDASEVHGESGIDGYDFGEPSIKPFSDDAVSILKDKLLHSNVPLTIIATGSFTNLGLLLSLYPEVKPKIKEFILMGGSLAQGNMTSVAEFNVFTDPHAARIVFSSGIKTTMIGLDCTLFGRISDETKDKIKLLGKAGNMLASIIERDIDHDETGTAIHDLQTIFYLLHPEKFTAKNFGLTLFVKDPPSAQPLRISERHTTTRQTSTFALMWTPMHSTSGSWKKSKKYAVAFRLCIL